MNRASPLIVCCSLILQAASVAAQTEKLSITLGLDWISVST
jgi:hypothetical protein